MKLILQSDSSPLVAVRAVFLAGSAHDRPGKWGAAWLVAQMLARGGSRRRTYKEILDALFPLGAAVSCHVDKEMSCFRVEAHRRHAARVTGLLCGMLLDPGWREEDLERLRQDAVNYLETGLRSENDEELARQALYGMAFRGHPYERHSAGAVRSLRRLGTSDLREFYLTRYSRENVIVAIGGGVPAGLEEQLRQSLASLPARPGHSAPPPAPAGPAANEMLLIEKPSRSVAISAGFPIDVGRGHPDYPALLVAASALGQHRNSGGRLFASMRQMRGLNYGDYAYIEYFPAPMFTLEPEPNHARHRQIFELWIRPVERAQAHFALRLALHELERFITAGLTQKEFERTRSFLCKYATLLAATRSARLGYAADSEFYGIGPYPEYVRTALSAMGSADVNAAVRRHLRWDRMYFALAGEGMAELRARILANDLSPPACNAPKAQALLEEDRTVERRTIEVPPERARVVPVEEMFG